MTNTQIFNVQHVSAEQLARAAAHLANGAVAVFATDTVYGIGTGALCEQAIQTIYTLKQRPATQPLQLLAASARQAQAWAHFSPEAERLAKAYWPGALTLIVPPSPAGKKLLRGAKGLGFRVAQAPFLQQLIAQMGQPMASTSANLHGQSVLTAEADVLRTFTGHVDYIFTNGTLGAVASSVVDFTQQPPRLLREGKILKNALEQTGGFVF